MANSPTKKKMVIHSTSPKMAWTWWLWSSALRGQLSSSSRSVGAGERDGSGQQVNLVREHEGEHDEREHADRLPQQPAVDDRLGRAHRHDARAGLLADLHAAAPDQVIDEHLQGEDDEDRPASD